MGKRMRKSVNWNFIEQIHNEAISKMSKTGIYVVFCFCFVFFLWVGEQ